MRLVVLERHSSGLIGIPVLGNVLSGLIRRRIRQISGGPDPCVLLIPDGFTGVPGSCVSSVAWNEIPLLASCQTENLDEFFQFNREAVKCLEESGRPTSKMSVPRALAYGFTAMHSEELPFWISGLESLLNQHRVTSVHVPRSANYYSRLVAAVATAKSIPVTFDSGLPLTFLGWSERLFRLIRRVALTRKFWCTSFAIDDSLPPRGGVFIGLGKARSERLAKPLQEAVESTTGKPSLIWSPHQIEKIAARFLCFDKLSLRVQLWRQWRKNQAALLQIPHTYRGVKIAPFQVPAMKEVWLDRAPRAAILARHADDLLINSGAEALLILEPLEIPALLADAARRLSIPVLFYYLLYDSAVSTAAIWEEGMRGLADTYATINPWMRDRLLVREISKSVSTHVVGDVLLDLTRTLAKPETLAKARDTLGITPGQPLVVVLSRQISTVLRSVEKEWMFRRASEAARALSARLIIKGHPNESRTQLEAQAKEWTGNYASVLINEIPLGTLISIADVVISSPGSASNMDVIYAHTPLVLAGPASLFDFLDRTLEKNAFRKNQAAICLSPPDGFLPAVQRILFDQAAREELRAHSDRFAEKISGPMDGNAGKRLATLITKLL